MADLTELESSQTVKIVGSTSDGTETNPLEVTTKGARIDNSFSSGANTRPSVTSTSSIVLAANTDRKYAILTNQSSNPLYLKLGATAVVGQGILLPVGASYEITAINLYTGAIHAIKQGGGSNTLEVFEGT